MDEVGLVCERSENRRNDDVCSSQETGQFLYAVLTDIPFPQFDSGGFKIRNQRFTAGFGTNDSSDTLWTSISSFVWTA